MILQERQTRLIRRKRCVAVVQAPVLMPHGDMSGKPLRVCVALGAAS